MTTADKHPSPIQATDLNPLVIKRESDASPCGSSDGDPLLTVEATLPENVSLSSLQNDLNTVSSRSEREHVHQTEAPLFHVHLRPSTCRNILDNHPADASISHPFWREILDAVEHTRETAFRLDLRENRLLDLTGRPAIMGVLNVTPDSFSDGGQYLQAETAVQRALDMQKRGASVIDVGGESTRPGAKPVPAAEEIDRVCPVIEQAARELRVPISVDTRKPEVARAALEVGAGMLNDVGGLQQEPELIDVAASYGVPAVAMHMQGTPETMQDQPTYDHVVRDVASFLRTSRRKAIDGGLDPGQVLLDPGIGFGKTQEHNLRLLREIERQHSLGSPLMLGTSRKSFIGRILETPVDQRVEGTAASIAMPVLQGVHLVRVHDVRAMHRFLKMLWTLHGSAPWRERLVRPADTFRPD